jgi:hypothetical protein
MSENRLQAALERAYMGNETLGIDLGMALYSFHFEGFHYSLLQEPPLAPGRDMP